MLKQESTMLHLKLLLLTCLACADVASAQRSRAKQSDADFGPVVRAYLGYLRAQQEVVDDRVSRREVDAAYYHRNSNRIRALRQMAVRIARETHNDYLPELEAVAPDELNILFEEPPNLEAVRVGETLSYTFRYLGAARSGRDKFYLFVRLDPFEQAELRKKSEAQSGIDASSLQSPTAEPASRPRRATAP